MKGAATRTYTAQQDGISHYIQGKGNNIQSSDSLQDTILVNSWAAAGAAGYNNTVAPVSEHERAIYRG